MKMENLLKITPFFLVLMFILCSCKKDSNVPPVIIRSKCKIASETYGLASNEKSYGYEYDANGNVNKVIEYRPNGSSSGSYNIDGNVVEYAYTFGNKPAYSKLNYNTSILAQPTQAFTNLINEFDGTVYIGYDNYEYSYDSKNQLTTVRTRRGTRKGGYEYDISINYNDQGNVTSIQYVYWTGPNVTIPLIVVNGYDDKPNPHAGINGWRYLLINTYWENVDPGAIIAQLSKNNPLGFTTGAGATLFERKIEYEYNSDGFPVSQKNTNKKANTPGEYTFYQTFTYVCK